MSGPPPKDPKLRQRRNKASTRADLRAEKRAPKPSLPFRGKDHPWHTLTLREWDEYWRSPISEKGLNFDKFGLFRLFELIDAYNYTPSKELAAEIRQQAASFGFTPLDRRRLEWAVRDDQTAGEEEERPPIRGAGRPIRSRRGGQDPRRLLQVVK